MKSDSPQAVEVKKVLDELINLASSAHFDILETLYHDDMNIYMLDPNRELHIMDKRGFINHLTESTKDGNFPSTWAKYHLVEADEKHGHVVISRKVNLTGEEQLITLSIDFVYESNRWQITREMIFAV